MLIDTFLSHCCSKYVKSVSKSRRRVFLQLSECVLYQVLRDKPECQQASDLLTNILVIRVHVCQSKVLHLFPDSLKKWRHIESWLFKWIECLSNWMKSRLDKELCISSIYYIIQERLQVQELIIYYYYYIDILCLLMQSSHKRMQFSDHQLLNWIIILGGQFEQGLVFWNSLRMGCSLQTRHSADARGDGSMPQGHSKRTPCHHSSFCSLLAPWAVQPTWDVHDQDRRELEQIVWRSCRVPMNGWV